MRKAGDVCFSQVFRDRGGKWVKVSVLFDYKMVNTEGFLSAQALVLLSL